MSAQLLPYNGTSGWSGSKASRERQMFLDETGETGKRQQAVLNELNALGSTGATWREIASVLDLHHGQASGVLSVLHSSGLISRLEARRNRCSIYVANNFVNGRTTAQAGRTKTSSDAEKLTKVRELLNQQITDGFLAVSIPEIFELLDAK
jgi:hypothetical protein